MKKKFIFVFLILALLPILASCTYLSTLRDLANKKSYPNKSITVNYYVDGDIYKTETTEKRSQFKYPEEPTKDSFNFGGWTYNNSYQTLDPEDFLYDNIDTLDLYAYFSKGTHFSDNLSYNGPTVSKGVLPSLGSPKVLVVPVNLGGETTNNMISNINTAFNGTSEETGYESVKSFYQKSSNDRLNLSFDVVDEWFTPSKNASYYANYDSSSDKYLESGAGLILREFLDAYDSSIDFTDYDYNGDGYIDSVWMIYNVEPSYTSTSDFYWAYVTNTINESKSYDDTKPRYYGFASYYFMFEKNLEVKYKKKLELYDMSDITYDAHTYIHETGHLLGLSDYYDTNATKGATGGIYTAGMMDANRGDLNSIDKLLLGWIDPYVIYANSEKSVTINSFSSSNDVILVSKVKPNSIYAEYFLIDLYNSEGLAASDVAICEPNAVTKAKARNKEYNNYGIRILHIDASLSYTYDGKKYDYPVRFLYDNSTTNKLFVDTVFNPNNTNISTHKNSELNKTVLNYYSLLSTAGTYNVSQTYRMTSSSYAYFDIKINEITSQSASIEILFS